MSIDTKYADIRYFDWYKSGRFLKRIRFNHLRESGGNFTLGYLCKSIEDESVLDQRNVGPNTVQNHIKALYEDGLISKDWYEYQWREYASKRKHTTYSYSGSLNAGNLSIINAINGYFDPYGIGILDDGKTVAIEPETDARKLIVFDTSREAIEFIMAEYKKQVGAIY